MSNFENLGIRKDLIKGLNELNIKTPTEIQEKVIPMLLNNTTDLVGQAQTVTGKTAAFALPILHKVDPKLKHTQALILCPTRELGKQIAKQLFKFTKYSEQVFTEAVYGGEKIELQIARLRRPTQIVVATPGRLLDLVRRKAVDLRKVKMLVLDEADEMLSMGFKQDLQEILTKVKTTESTWLFSATMPAEIQKIIKTYLSPNAQRIAVQAETVVNANINHQYTLADENEKFSKLVKFLKSYDTERGIIFCKTKKTTQDLAKRLIAKNFATDAIHGDLQQKERDKVLRAFKNEKLQILVATDLAARGLDIDALSYVAHFTLPDTEDYYTHRSGRTARAGRTGLSISFLTTKELPQLNKFHNSLGFKLTQVD